MKWRGFCLGISSDLQKGISSSKPALSEPQGELKNEILMYRLRHGNEV